MSWEHVLLAAEWLLGSWFAYAVRHNFNHTSEGNWRLSILVVISAVIGLWHTYRVLEQGSNGNSLSILFSSALLLIAAGLFSSSLAAIRGRGLYVAFSNCVPDRLVSAGPYCFVRHPLYTAYIVFWFSLVVLSGDPLVLTGVVAVTAFYVAAARSEERHLLVKRDLDYEAYRSRTGMFLPKLRHIKTRFLGSARRSL